MAEFDSLAEQLFKLTDKLDFNGRLIILPRIDRNLRIRVEWNKPGCLRYSYEAIITPEEACGNISIMDMFIDNANRAINDHYSINR